MKPKINIIENAPASTFDPTIFTEGNTLKNDPESVVHDSQFKNVSMISSVSDDSDKMDDFRVFAACCKGYCAINILILPK